MEYQPLDTIRATSHHPRRALTGPGPGCCCGGSPASVLALRPVRRSSPRIPALARDLAKARPNAPRRLIYEDHVSAIGKTANAHGATAPLLRVCGRGSRATPRLKHGLSITGNDIAGKRSSCKPPDLQAMPATVKIGGSPVVCRLSGEDEPDRVAWLDHFSPSMTTQCFSLGNNSLKNRFL